LSPASKAGPDGIETRTSFEWFLGYLKACTYITL